jgi:hypothetical protein
MTEPSTPPPSQPPGSDSIATPVIVDMGRKKRKAFRRLRRGRDQAMGEVAEIVEEVRQQLGDRAEGTILLPVVVLYENKRPRRARWF